MNKKKLLTMVLALVLIGAVGIGATLAYFTDKTEVANVITMGHVDIDLEEPAFEDYAEEGIKDVTPGQEIAKDPTITLAADSLDAYVRVKLTVNGFEDIESDVDFAAAVLEGLDIQEGWTLAEDGYYYYADKLTQDNNSTTLFTKVTIPYEWNNDVAGVTFTIDVAAEAIQAENLAEDFLNNDGSWSITAEEMLEYKPAAQEEAAE